MQGWFDQRRPRRRAGRGLFTLITVGAALLLSLDAGASVALAWHLGAPLAMALAIWMATSVLMETRPEWAELAALGGSLAAAGIAIAAHDNASIWAPAALASMWLLHCTAAANDAVLLRSLEHGLSQAERRCAEEHEQLTAALARVIALSRERTRMSEEMRRLRDELHGGSPRLLGGGPW